ncbi:MAG: hypothetical protein OFPII_04070 [Osedax symbiont Rs1]|nr:MAG: hypothetical protein OFPII_04070 [Osedax symbiont Rs1]
MNSKKNRLYKEQHYKLSKWKNGRGDTLELASDSELAKNGAFDWRLSIATLSGDSQYSCFNGIDRSQILLQGERVVLSIGNAETANQIKLNRYDKAVFSGAEQVSCQLLGCTIAKMFNLMTAAHSYSHLLSIHQLSAQMPIVTACDTLLIFSVSDALQVQVSGRETALQWHEMLRIEQPALQAIALDNRASTDLNTIIIVELFKR